MRQFIKRTGRSHGVTVSAIVKLQQPVKMPVTRQTVHRWLSEDQAAALVEKDKFSGWKRRSGL